jgi:hypothetical protein
MNHWDPSLLYYIFALLLAKPPGTGVQEAGIQYCTMVISQLVQGLQALVWTNPCSGMDIEIPSGRGPENMDES